MAAARVCSALQEFSERLRASRYRGLALLLGSPDRVYQTIADCINASRGLLVFWPGEGVDTARSLLRGWDMVYQGHIHYRLGEEHDVVVVDAYSGFRPSVLAAVGEMVVAGGLLVLTARGQWPDIKLPMVSRLFTDYLASAIARAGSVLIAEVDSDNIVKMEAPTSRAAEWLKTSKSYGLPRWVLDVALCDDQVRVVSKAVEVMEKQEACSLLVLGDRGRGKSAAVGIALAYLVWKRMIGNVVATAPSPHSIQSLFRVMAKALRRAGVRFKLVWDNNLVVMVKGGWFKIEYMEPWKPFTTPLVVVDEAAAVGPARLRRIAQRARKLIASTTIHGYEGSGRSLAHRIKSILPSPQTLEMTTPIRYPPRDPLEKLLYSSLMLDVEPEEPPATSSPSRLALLDPSHLARDPNLLRKVYGILVQAHYRNTPDDLAMLLSEYNQLIAAVLLDDKPIGVAQVFIEDGMRMLTDILSRVGVDAAKIARVVRIAVHPKLQRRGYGSRLLAYVEEQARRLYGVEVVGAVYSNPEVTRFWIANGYHVIYISPRFNRVTGEKNIAVAKPVTKDARKLVEEAACRFQKRLALTLSTVYRDLEAEVVADLAEGLVKCSSTPVSVGDEMLARLTRVLEGSEELEYAYDVALALAANALAAGHLSILSYQERLAVVAAVLQGKPITETARILGLDLEATRRILLAGLEKLYKTMYG